MSLRKSLGSRWLFHGPGLAASQLGAGLGSPAGLGQSKGQVGEEGAVFSC